MYILAIRGLKFLENTGLKLGKLSYFGVKIFAIFHYFSILSIWFLVSYCSYASVLFNL